MKAMMSERLKEILANPEDRDKFRKALWNVQPAGGKPADDRRGEFETHDGKSLRVSLVPTRTPR